MKMIAAVVQPHRLDEIREALNSIGIHGMTASEVQGYGRQGGHKEIYRGAEYDIHFVPKIKIEIKKNGNKILFTIIFNSILQLIRS